MNSLSFSVPLSKRENSLHWTLVPVGRPGWSAVCGSFGSLWPSFPSMYRKGKIKTSLIDASRCTCILNALCTERIVYGSCYTVCRYVCLSVVKTRSTRKHLTMAWGPTTTPIGLACWTFSAMSRTMMMRHSHHHHHQSRLQSRRMAEQEEQRQQTVLQRVALQQTKHRRRQQGQLGLGGVEASRPSAASSQASGISTSI